MKNTKPKLGLLVAAALIGVSHTSQAQTSTAQEEFVPLEKLSPEARVFYEQQVHELEQNMRIDWESVILGVDGKGILVLKDRRSANLDMVAEPSCWTNP